MSRDREARVLAAAETIEIEIDGKKTEYKLRPVVAQHLCDLEKEALRYHKREFLMTFAENDDLLGDRAQTVIDEKLEEAARWDLSDLPQKDAYDVSRVKITKEVKRWIEENYGDLPEAEAGQKALLSNALDTGRLKPDQLKKMAGKGPLQGKVRFDQWWVTASMEGMISFITTSVRRDHPEVTKRDVANWPFTKIAEAVRKVEGITSASMGNG